MSEIVCKRAELIFVVVHQIVWLHTDIPEANFEIKLKNKGDRR